MNYLSICAVVKNEAPYIEEWVDFHCKQGIEHFYLFDNESTDGTKNEVSHLKNITWHNTKGPKQQCKSYKFAIDEYTKSNKWMAFIDVDEFLYTKVPERSFKEMLEAYDEMAISGLAVHWQLFGSNGHLTYCPEPVIKRFTKRAKYTNHHVKSVMRLEKTIAPGNDPHSFKAIGSVVNEKFDVLPEHYAIHTPAVSDIFAINHYVTKSKEEHDKRRALPDANTGRFKPIDEHFTAHDCNEVEDYMLYCMQGYQR